MIPKEEEFKKVLQFAHETITNLELKHGLMRADAIANCLQALNNQSIKERLTLEEVDSLMECLIKMWEKAKSFR